MSAYQNKSSQAEREAVLRNDQRAATMQGRAQAEADDVRGRWAEINKSNVVGATPTVQYPRLPSGPWADPVQIPPEEPLGYDINEVPICGEPHELTALDDTPNATIVADVAASPCGEVVVSSSEVEAMGDATTEAVAQSALPLAAAVAPSEVNASPADVERAPAIPTPTKRRGL